MEDEGEFVIVSSKRGKKSRPPKAALSSSNSSGLDQVIDSAHERQVQRGSKKKITASAPKENGKEDVVALFSSVESSALYNEVSENLRAYSSEQVEFYEITDVVCYGIGNFLSSRKCMFQLAFAVLLWKRHFAKGSLLVFDPVFTKKEEQVIEELGGAMIPNNEVGKRSVKHRTLFFMPHCGKILYNNLLWANWEAESLSQVLILGNSFLKYHETANMQPVEKRSEGYYIDKAQPFTQEKALSKEFPMPFVFNDTSLVSFSRMQMDELPANFWADTLKEITYGKTEVVTTER